MSNSSLLRALLAEEARPAEKAPPPRRSGPGPRVAAVVVWLAAVYTTYLAIVSLQPGTPWWLSAVFALGAQYVFTMAERPIMSCRANLFTLVVFAFDAAVNAGGLFPLLRNVGRTPTAQMLAASGVAPVVDVTPALLLSLVAGAIIAVAPEALWRMRE